MAIITPLKKIFNWQTASEKIPYKVYTAYITVDDNEEMYASQVLENTIGNITFEKVTVVPTGAWSIKLPYKTPRLKIMIPGFGDFWCNNTAMVVSNGSSDKRLTIYPGFGNICPEPTCFTDEVRIELFDVMNSVYVSWASFFICGGSAPFTSYPIEIRVYN